MWREECSRIPLDWPNTFCIETAKLYHSVAVMAITQMMRRGFPRLTTSGGNIEMRGYCGGNDEERNPAEDSKYNSCMGS
ncbi:hypothetical protein Dda_6955 [Drechslerella dactyloides]|uniref:Uncharacterized protein n=1 Tax=Drechslerella dactyloides TaxID=74499 RepID=A0AAD6IT41_DREDA|nr:hypothetical protein Dda_6955 [Drechslerella dactyloides]